MLATVLITFIDRKKGVRYNSGDVVSISANDFERINAQGKTRGVEFFKKGRHRFGDGVCKPCRKLNNKKEKK